MKKNGLDIVTLDNGDRLVSQGGCRLSILERYANMTSSVKGRVSKIGDIRVFDSAIIPPEDDLVLLDDRLKKVYISIIMSMMVLSRLTRYDMLFWNTYLSTKCKSPNRGDMAQACKMLKYLETSGNWGIRYVAKSRVGITMWCDASHACITTVRGRWVSVLV